MTKNRLIGDILREERQRLGMTQAEFAAVGGLEKRTLIRYEQNEAAPDAAYLRALAEIGVDVEYVVTGVRGISAVSEEEKELLSLYRSLDYRGKGGAWGVMNGILSAQPGNINGAGNQSDESFPFKPDDEPAEIREIKERYKHASPAEKEVILELARQAYKSHLAKKKIAGTRSK